MKQTKRKTIDLAVLTVIGAILRFIRIFWGYPNPLHADEPYVIESAMDILQRHSWESQFYSWPCQFPIKIDAILFQIFSYIRYHVPAYVAFESHKFVFYLIARSTTAVYGTLMIPFSFLLLNKAVNKLKWEHVPFIGALIVTIFPLFVEHSAYATSDIPLAFCCLLISYVSMFYLEKGTTQLIFLLSVLTGISVTIKYPGALHCLFLAVIIIVYAIKERDLCLFFRHGVICFCTVFFTIFVIAPNLITNMEKVVDILGIESSSAHLGVSEMTYWAKMKFYFESCFSDLGLIIGVLILVGIYVLFRIKNIISIGFFPGFLFYFSLCALGLHWSRWGMPVYITLLLVACIGWGKLSDILNHFKMNSKNKKVKILVYIFDITVIFVFAYGIMNTLLSTLLLEKEVFLSETRNVSEVYCIENNITRGNSIYEGYTPLATSYDPGGKTGCFTISDGHVKVLDEYKDKKYFVMSTSFYGRYLSEGMNSKEFQIYELIDKEYDLIYELKPVTIYYGDGIIRKIKSLLSSGDIVGNTIRIYKLN